MTPKSAVSEDFVEWAAFWPSLPCGDSVEGSTSPYAELPKEAEAAVRTPMLGYNPNG